MLSDGTPYDQTPIESSAFDPKNPSLIPAPTGIEIDVDVAVPMRDGTALIADVFRPRAEGRYPTVLVRTPYDKRLAPASLTNYGFDVLAAARAGYVVVIQDVRGTFASEGRLQHFHDERRDGAASIAWVASQSWSNGSIGMAGASYLGATQLLAALAAPPALKAIAPTITGCDPYGWLYQGGAFQLAFALSWAVGMANADLTRRERRGDNTTDDRAILEELSRDLRGTAERLPLAEIPRRTTALNNYGDWLQHPDCDGFWRAAAAPGDYASIDVPALHVAGWYDIFLKGSLKNYTDMRDGRKDGRPRHQQRLIIAPWTHYQPSDVVGDLWLGTAAGPGGIDLTGEHLAFFDTFLKANEPPDESVPVRLFVMGKNRWREEDGWPPARAVPTRLYLRAEGGLRREAPSDEAFDEFVYDPNDPVPTIGGNTLSLSSFFAGPRDRRPLRRRRDVLCYTTEVLAHDLEVTGPIRARLHVSTSALDTDFTVTLVDVHPDGRAFGIADGIVRLRYREGFETQRLAEPGRIYEIDVDLVATSNVFLASHRISIEVSSSNFPRFDRNPNNGGVISEATAHDLIPAKQRIYHTAEHASHVVVPVIAR